MSIKEKPLFKAVSELGPLPKFLFSNPVFAGVITALMCAVFGGFAVMFVTLGHGNIIALELFEATRWGAIFTLALAALIFLGIAVSALLEPEEAKYRLLFVFGGFLGIAMLVVLDHFALESLRNWLVNVRPVVGSGG